jgi:tetratricopeptide (TPR) repeat protein
LSVKSFQGKDLSLLAIPTQQNSVLFSVEKAIIKVSIGDYNLAIKLKPDYANAYNNRGYAKSNLGDEKGAIDDYNLAAKLFQEQGQIKYSKIALEQVKKLSK